MIQSEEKAHDEPAPTKGEPDRGQQTRGRRQVVLLVEDSETDRHLYGGLLWYNGFDVFHAGDGETGVQRALELRPDLILLDIMLPGPMDGLAVARELKSRGLDAPVILLSARSRDEFGDIEQELGVVQYLEKPIDPFLVLKEVVRLIGYARLDEPPA